MVSERVSPFATASCVLLDPATKTDIKNIPARLWRLFDRFTSLQLPRPILQLTNVPTTMRQPEAREPVTAQHGRTASKRRPDLCTVADGWFSRGAEAERFIAPRPVSRRAGAARHLRFGCSAKRPSAP